MNVAAVLKAKGSNVATAAQTVSLQEIAKRLSDERIGAIVILDDDGNVVGILSERDLVRAVAEGGGEALKKPVADVMTRDVVTCTKDHSIDELMAIMTKGRFRHVPVMEDNQLAGLVSIGDVVKNHIAEVEMEVLAMKDYLATG